MADRHGAPQDNVDASDGAAPATGPGGALSKGPVQTVDPAATRADAEASAQGEQLQAPPSPCVSVCALDENDLCMGCYRTATEITDWFMATPAEKHAILRAAEERRAADSPIRLL